MNIAPRLRSTLTAVTFALVAALALVVAPSSPVSANSVAIDVLGPNPTTPGSQVEVQVTFNVDTLGATQEVSVSLSGGTIAPTFNNSPGLLFCDRDALATGITCETPSTGNFVLLFTVETSGVAPTTGTNDIVIVAIDSNDNATQIADIDLTTVAINSVDPVPAVAGQPIDVEVGYYQDVFGQFEGSITVGTITNLNIAPTPGGGPCQISTDGLTYQCTVDPSSDGNEFTVTYQIDTIGVADGPITISADSDEGGFDFATAAVGTNTVTIDSVTPSQTLTDQLVDVQATFEIAGLGAEREITNFVTAGTVQNIVFPGGLVGCDIANDSRGFTCPVTAPQTYVVTYQVNVAGVPAGTDIIVNALDANSATLVTDTIEVVENSVSISATPNPATADTPTNGIAETNVTNTFTVLALDGSSIVLGGSGNGADGQISDLTSDPALSCTPTGATYECTATAPGTYTISYRFVTQIAAGGAIQLSAADSTGANATLAVPVVAPPTPSTTSVPASSTTAAPTASSTTTPSAPSTTAPSASTPVPSNPATTVPSTSTTAAAGSTPIVAPTTSVFGTVAGSLPATGSSQRTTDIALLAVGLILLGLSSVVVARRTNPRGS